MLAIELITDEIPPLKLSDTAIKAIGWMDEFKVSDLPVVEGSQFRGMISEIDLLDLDSAERALSDSNLPLEMTSVQGSQHVFDVIRVISDQQLSVIPVVDEEGNYLGSISGTHLMEVISKMSVVSDSGGIIVLELNVNDYMMSQIARIVEDNDAKILGTFITSHPDSTKMELTIKVNKSNLDAILATFERFDYTVTASYGQLDFRDDMRDRFDSFMRYLDL